MCCPACLELAILPILAAGLELQCVGVSWNCSQSVTGHSLCRAGGFPSDPQMCPGVARPPSPCLLSPLRIPKRVPAPGAVPSSLTAALCPHPAVGFRLAQAPLLQALRGTEVSPSPGPGLAWPGTARTVSGSLNLLLCWVCPIREAVRIQPLRVTRTYDKRLYIPSGQPGGPQGSGSLWGGAAGRRQRLPVTF